MSNIVTPQGHIVGKPAITLDWDFRDATTPAWLTYGLTAGTNPSDQGATYVHDAAGRPGVKVTTEAASARRAGVKLPEFNMDACRMIRWRVQFTVGATQPPIISLSLHKVDAKATGASLIRYGADRLFIRASDGSAGRLVKSRTPYIQPNKVYDLSVLVDVVNKSVYVMHGDQVSETWRNISTLNTATESVSPHFYIGNGSSTTTGGATALALGATIHRVTLERWY